MEDNGRYYWTCRSCGEWFIMAHWLLEYHADAFPGHKDVEQHFQPPLTEEQGRALNVMFAPTIGTIGQELTPEMLERALLEEA